MSGVEPFAEGVGRGMGFTVRVDLVCVVGGCVCVCVCVSVCVCVCARVCVCVHASGTSQDHIGNLASFPGPAQLSVAY